MRIGKSATKDIVVIFVPKKIPGVRFKFSVISEYYPYPVIREVRLSLVVQADSKCEGVMLVVPRNFISS